MPIEPILEPQLPIVDPHHHLWDRTMAPPLPPEIAKHPFMTVIALNPRYLFDEFRADLASGHNVRATVFVECTSMYNADAPERLRPVGETEFVNGVAAMSASGVYGELRACAGIVSRADFMQGDAVREVLEAHLAAAPHRFRGVRHSASFDADSGVLGPLARYAAGLYVSDAFRVGFKHLAQMGLSFDAWLLEPQLPDLIDLVRRFPDTTIVLDHVGTPLGLASYAGRQQERFGIWRERMTELSRFPNLNVKLGGLGMSFCNFESFMCEPPATSEVLARHWRPYIETTIELFGANRCMFESNFPVDRGSCTYDVLWNAFKRIAASYSADEKRALFSGTAERVYRLEKR
jgi:predicted TIM-barrel fold metal-dependent hydrolase